MTDFIDLLVLALLCGILIGVFWFLRLVEQIDQSKINKLCKSVAYTVKAGDWSTQILNSVDSTTGLGISSALGTIPPNDLTINFQTKC